MDFAPAFQRKKHRKKTSIHHCDEARSFLFIVVQKRSNDKRIYLFYDNLFLRWYKAHSHSLWGSFPQLLSALFWANSREFSLVLLRFSLYSLCSQPVWRCFGIKVWYQFSEKSAEKKSVILFGVIDTWLCPTVQLALMFGYKGRCKGRAP